MVIVIIGRRYKETFRRLEEAVRTEDGRVIVSKPKDDDGRYACYSCLRNIPSRVAVMIEELTEKGEQTHYLHRNCYENIRNS